MSNDIDLLIESIPLPPPWVYLSDTNQYKNEITNEILSIHPLIHYINNQNIKQNELTFDIEDNNQLNQLKYGIFHCGWKEINPVGKCIAYQLTVKFYSNLSADVWFDNMPKQRWNYSHLDGNYGPIDRYDMFIGNKIKLFGKNLSIISADGHICKEIDIIAKQIINKQIYITDHIERYGIRPCVEVKQSNGSIYRSSQHPGHYNLRLLNNNTMKLNEQLYQLNLNDIIIDANEKYDINSLFWKYC